jgi:hypothetical protein
MPRARRALPGSEERASFADEDRFSCDGNDDGVPCESQCCGR